MGYRKMKITKAQQKSLFRKWQQSNQGKTYLEFRRSVQQSFYDDCIMVQWCGMWLGIETDGYTHS